MLLKDSPRHLLSQVFVGRDLRRHKVRKKIYLYSPRDVTINVSLQVGQFFFFFEVPRRAALCPSPVLSVAAPSWGLVKVLVRC